MDLSSAIGVVVFILFLYFCVWLEEKDKLIVGVPTSTNVATKPTTLTYYYADWCHACKNMTPVVNKVEDIIKDRVKIIRVNIDTHKGDKPSTIPTLLLRPGNGDTAIEYNGGPSVDTLATFATARMPPKLM
jgi:thiol-disulfide isomerase/thioredoxin